MQGKAGDLISKFVLAFSIIFANVRARRISEGEREREEEGWKRPVGWMQIEPACIQSGVHVYIIDGTTPKVGERSA